MTSLSARSSKGFNVTLGSFLSRKPASPFSSFLGLFPWLIIFFFTMFYNKAQFWETCKLSYCCSSRSVREVFILTGPT